MRAFAPGNAGLDRAEGCLAAQFQAEGIVRGVCEVILEIEQVAESGAIDEQGAPRSQVGLVVQPETEVRVSVLLIAWSNWISRRARARTSSSS